VCPIGLLLLGTLADTVGRRTALQVAYITIFLSWLIIALANSYEALLIGRIIQGISYGE